MSSLKARSTSTCKFSASDVRMWIRRAEFIQALCTLRRTHFFKDVRMFEPRSRVPQIVVVGIGSCAVKRDSYRSRLTLLHQEAAFTTRATLR